jgi:alpha-L-rhamnosidase
MKSWVDKVADTAGTDRLWTGGFQFGDWLDPTAPADQPSRAKADPDVIATAYLARSAQIVADTARVLGDDDDAEKYGALAQEVRTAFALAFVTGSGRILSDSPTVYALAIQWDLLPTAGQRQTAGRRLADLVRSSGFRISTGFVGTPLVCDALTATGHSNVAYRLLFQTKCPSWLYPVTVGATSIWERWDSMLPDGRINPGEMTSFNHYALGAVADWLHRTVAGLAPSSPGYRTIAVRPVLNPGLKSASATHLTPYGRAEVAWERDGETLRLQVTVPTGASAKVHIPGTTKAEIVTHGSHVWHVPDPVPTDQPLSWPSATVRDLVDSPSDWDRVVGLAIECGLVADDEAAAQAAAPYFDAPATAIAQALAPEDRAPGAKRLRERLSLLIRAAGHMSGPAEPSLPAAQPSVTPVD